MPALLPRPSSLAAAALPALVPIAAELAATVASLYPSLALSGSGSSAAHTPTKGTPALPSRAAAGRTPPRAAGATPMPSVAALASPGGPTAGWAPPPPDVRAIDSVLMPVAQLMAAVARAALQDVAKLPSPQQQQQCGGGGVSGNGWRHAGCAVGAATDLFCSVKHAEVARRLLDAWQPLLLDWVAALQTAAPAGAIEAPTAAQQAAAAAAAAVPAAARAADAAAGEALEAWSRLMRHWTGLPLMEDSAPHIQG